MLTILTVASVISLAISVTGVVLKVTAGAELIGALNDAMDISNMESLKLFDTPYMNITSNALGMIVNFMQYATLLVSICAFLALIFNAFQMWCSTLEFKKFYADAIYKCLVVMILMNVYPTVVTKTYLLATELGVEASGGEKKIITAFSGLAKKTKKIWDTGTKSMIEQLQNGVGPDGKIVVNQAVIKSFTDYGMTESEAIAWANANGIEVSTSKLSWKQTFNQVAAINAFKNDTEKQKYMKQSMAIIRAMSQILTGTSDSAMADGSISATEILKMGDDTLNNVFYNPYIKGTKRLSFSAMMKTAVIIAECASAGALASTEETDESKQSSWEDLAKSKKPHLLFDFVGKLLMSTIVYKIMMLIAVGYCMIEYIVTLIEYLVVAAVSALLIPLFFIDATKQFAMNILKSIFSYFIKILVTTMMIFFVISMYIDLGSLILARKDLDSILSLIVYACIVMLGMVLVKNSGKIAGAVISGNPSMGLGDIVHQARGMSAAMHHASHEMKQFGNQVKGAAAATKKFGGDMADIGKARAGAKAAGSQTFAGLDAANKSGRISMSEKDIRHEANAAKRSHAFHAGKQMIGDSAYKALTGRDRNHDEKGALRVGQMFEFQPDSYRQATEGDVQNANAKRADETAKERIDQVIANQKYQNNLEKPIEEAHLTKNRLGKNNPLEGPEPGK